LDATEAACMRKECFSLSGQEPQDTSVTLQNDYSLLGPIQRDAVKSGRSETRIVVRAVFAACLLNPAGKRNETACPPVVPIAKNFPWQRFIWRSVDIPKVHVAR